MVAADRRNWTLPTSKPWKLTLSLSLVLVLSEESRARNGLAVFLSQSSSSGTVPVERPARKKKPVKFQNIMMGELTTEDGVRLGFTTFKASDGVKLTAIDGEFVSAQRAHQEFDKEVAKAAKVIERGKKKDKRGTIVGERAQILVRTKAPDMPTPAVVWTNGSWFREILSTSVPDILELEKWYTD